MGQCRPRAEHWAGRSSSPKKGEARLDEHPSMVQTGSCSTTRISMTGDHSDRRCCFPRRFATRCNGPASGLHLLLLFMNDAHLSSSTCGACCEPSLVHAIIHRSRMLAQNEGPCTLCIPLRALTASWSLLIALDLVFSQPSDIEW